MKHSPINFTWQAKHYSREHSLIWTLNKKNMVVDTGERAFLDTFLRDRGSEYFGMTNFYIGFYYGSISESTTLPLVPGEPAEAYGYSRQLLERSSLGWPVLEKVDGDWQAVSKEFSFVGSAGSIGPISGTFLCTSSDSSGFLISALPFGLDKTILSGETFTFTISAR